MDPKSYSILIVGLAFTPTIIIGTICVIIYYKRFNKSWFTKKEIVYNSEPGKENEENADDLPPSYEELFEVTVNCENTEV